MKLHSVTGDEAGAEKPANPRPVPSRRSPDSSRYCDFVLLVWLAILVPTALSAAPANRTGELPPELTLTVRVYNYAKVPAGKLRRAEDEARGVIGGADVETIWLDCTAAGPELRPGRGSRHQECSATAAVEDIVTLRILNRFDHNGATLKPGIFGYANRPEVATVLYDRIAAFADRDGYEEDAAVLLGEIVAHEIGHLLLGPDAHSPAGIMRGHWDRAQVRRAILGTLMFTSDESSKIRAAIEVTTESQGLREALLEPPIRRTAPGSAEH